MRSRAGESVQAVVADRVEERARRWPLRLWLLVVLALALAGIVWMAGPPLLAGRADWLAASRARGETLLAVARTQPAWSLGLAAAILVLLVVSLFARGAPATATAKAPPPAPEDAPPDIPPEAAPSAGESLPEAAPSAGESLPEAAPDPPPPESAPVSGVPALGSDAPVPSSAPEEPAPSLAPRTPAVPVAVDATGARIRIFVSHSSADDDFGDALAERLRATFGDAWYDSQGEPQREYRDGLLAADQWLPRIEHELGQRGTFVVLLSPAALASPWVAQEIRLALIEAVNTGKVLVPVLREPVESRASFLLTYQWVSFLPERDEAEAWAELEAAIRLGRSRMVEIETSGQVYRPVFDLTELPRPERFIGREDLIGWAMERLAADPAVNGLASIAAANGLGGIGKSTLAGEVVRRLFIEGRFPDGIGVVACNGVRDPAAVLAAALERFGIKADEKDRADADALARLARRQFAGRRALIVLDNVEPEWPVERVVRPLREAGVALLLTSRQTLAAGAVPPAATRELHILPNKQALELFAVNYGAEAWRTLALKQRKAAARVVRTLGNHTLAVHLAAIYAARQQRPLERLAREYKTNPRLAFGLKDGSEAMEAVLSSSYAALPPGAQRLLAAFGTMEAGREATLALASSLDERAARVSLDALVDFHLLGPFVNAGMGGAGDYERLRMHALVRAWAGDLFAGDAWPEEARADVYRALATWYAGYANATDDFALLADEANIEDALAHAIALGEDKLVARLCVRMSAYWRDRGRTPARRRYLPAGLEAAERVAAHGDRDDRLDLAGLQLASADLQLMLGQVDGAERLYEQALAIMREVGDRREEGVALSKLGDIALGRDNLAGAERLYEQYLAIMREVGDRQQEGVALSKLGDIALGRDDLAGAERLYEQALAIMREVGARQQEGVALASLGLTLMLDHKRDEGCAMLRQAAALFVALRDERSAEQVRNLVRAAGCDV